VIRKSLTGEEPVYTGYTTVLGNTSQELCPEAFKGDWFDHSITLGAGRGYTFFGCHHPPSEIFWSLAFESPKGALSHLAWDKPNLKAEIVKKVQQEGMELTPVLKRMLETGEVLNLIEYHDITPKPLSAIGRLTSRRDGRITLIGDAAHLMVPFRGQGGNNALLDSRHLVGNLVALAEEQERQGAAASGSFNLQERLFEALSEYEAEMTRRTTKEVLESREAMHSVHEKNPIKVWGRNRIFGFVHWVASTNQFERFLIKAAAVGVLAGVSLGVYSKVTGTSPVELVTRGLNLFKSHLKA